jgi:hypothetical protein
MSVYGARREDLARQSAEQREQARQAALAQAKDFAPLDERLKKVLEDLPPDLLREGVGLRVIQERLRGRKHGHAHCGEVGAALRRLGFEKKRDWRARATGGHRALWRKPA